jgi:HlyD family secretion protein
MNGLMGFLVGIIGLVIPGFGTSPEPAYSGYVEADYVYAAPSTSGVLASLNVREGQVVRRGDVLFVLNHDQQEAALRAAEARVEAARATAANLATGSRAEEVAVVRASLSRAQTDLALAEMTLARTEKLVAQGVAPQARADQDRASVASARAEVAQLQAQLAVAELPARVAQQAAAEANFVAAEADANKARADLADRTVPAPVDGRVERLYYDGGEMAMAGVPVVSLLPEGALKARFYVNEADRQRFALGDTVAVSCDGCAPGLTGTLTYLASDPQNTPPIIYSRDERSRLVFMAEARLDGGTIHPGQPVTVRRLGGG